MQVLSFASRESVGAAVTLPLDHLVLPVADLATARERLAALGFTVAPEGVHPFGTANCCVYLAGGTFLEPLAVADPQQAAAAIEASNAFVARDHDHRHRAGSDGFSALAFGTADAAADDRRYRAAGLSAGPMLEFSRPFRDAGGRTAAAAFRLAFAAHPASPSSYFFAVEKVDVPAVDRAALERHPNGVSRLAGVVLSAAEPARLGAFFEAVAGATATEAAAGGWSFETPSGRVEIRHGTPPEALRLEAVRFAVADAGALEALFKRRAIAYEWRDDALHVAPAAGQGALFVFEAER